MHDLEGVPRVHHFLCTRCGYCVEVCHQHVLEMTDRGLLVAHPERCGGCALCEDLCPEGAIDCEFEIVWEDDAGYYGKDAGERRSERRTR